MQATAGKEGGRECFTWLGVVKDAGLRRVHREPRQFEELFENLHLQVYTQILVLKSRS